MWLYRTLTRRSASAYDWDCDYSCVNVNMTVDASMIMGATVNERTNKWTNEESDGRYERVCSLRSPWVCENEETAEDKKSEWRNMEGWYGAKRGDNCVRQLRCCGRRCRSRYCCCWARASALVVALLTRGRGGVLLRQELQRTIQCDKITVKLTKQNEYNKMMIEKQADKRFKQRRDINTTQDKHAQL